MCAKCQLEATLTQTASVAGILNCTGEAHFCAPAFSCVLKSKKGLLAYCFASIIIGLRPSRCLEACLEIAANQKIKDETKLEAALTCFFSVVLVVQLESRHSCVADRLVVVRFPAGPRVRLKTVDPPKGNGLGTLFMMRFAAMKGPKSSFLFHCMTTAYRTVYWSFISTTFAARHQQGNIRP